MMTSTSYNGWFSCLKTNDNIQCCGTFNWLVIIAKTQQYKSQDEIV